MRIPALCFLIACASALACQEVVDDSQARCDDVTAQIDAALLDYTESGNLLPTAVACELTPPSFDPRVSRENVARVLDQFSAACQQQAACCSGHCLAEPTPVESPPEEVGPSSVPPPYVTARTTSTATPQ